MTKMMDSTAGFNIPLFDATCFNGTDYLDAVVNLTVNDFRENNGNFSELAIYLQEQLTLNISGQLYSLNASALKIDFGDAILRGEDTSILRTIPVSGGDKGKLANDHETVVVLVDAQVLDFNAPPSPGNTSVSISWACDIDAQLTLALQCVVGSPDIGLEAVLRLCKCPANAELAFDFDLTQRNVGIYVSGGGDDCD
jgi:hypothetical protein